MNKFLAIFTFSVFAAVTVQAQDLTLPGAKWVGAFDKYVCSTTEVATAVPEAFSAMKLEIGEVVTDQSLDHALLKATYEENGKTCRYNAILFSDNAAKTIELVQSVAFDPAGGSSRYIDCRAGKETLDMALAGNEYLYYGHPHNLAIMVVGVGAEAVCGGRAAVGINFVVKGKLTP